MRFWDTSALVPLIISEPSSGLMRDLLRKDPAVLVWSCTPVEGVSALARAHRNRRLAAQELQESLARLRKLLRAAPAIQPSRAVADRAERLLLAHELRAPDAFQLAAALTGAEDRSPDSSFVSLDRRLREAAVREGFTVLSVAM